MSLFVIDFGFNGKSLIHPDQIDVCNKVYSPSESDIHHAKRVVSAFELSRAGIWVHTFLNSNYYMVTFSFLLYRGEIACSTRWKTN